MKDNVKIDKYDPYLRDSFFAMKRKMSSPPRADISNEKNSNFETIVTDNADSLNLDEKNIEFRLRVSLGEKTPGNSEKESEMKKVTLNKKSVVLAINFEKMFNI